MDNDSWRIKSIEVSGLLYSHDIFWELMPKVNILGGPNGSGKSTLLHALAILLQGAPKEDSDIDEVSTHCEAPFKSLTAEFVSGCTTSIKRVVNSTRERIDDSYLAATGKTRVKVKENIVIHGSRNLPDGIDASSLHVPHILYVNSSDQALSTISRLAENAGNDKRPAKTVLDLMLEQALNSRNQLFAQRLSIAMQQENETELVNLRNLFGRFETAVRYFMPQYILKDTSTLTFSLESVKDTAIRYFRMSTGEKQLLYILLTVCNTLGEPTILLLDEADTGLHIDWKKDLLKELLKINPDMQIIAATHSPSLIEGWYDNVKEISELYYTAADISTNE